MTNERLVRAKERAYEFARSGAFGTMALLEQRLAREGFAGDMHWLEGPGVRTALAELSARSRQLQMSAERQTI